MEITTIPALIIFAAGLLLGGIISYYLCKSNTPTPDGNLAGHLVSNFDVKRYIGNKERDGSNDSIISGHIPMNVILPYISMLQEESKTAVETVAGIEFYFTREDDEIDGPGDLNFLLYPTYLNSTGTLDEQGVLIPGSHYIPYDPIASKNSLVTLMTVKGTTNHDNNLIALNRANMSPPRGHTW